MDSRAMIRSNTPRPSRFKHLNILKYIYIGIAALLSVMLIPTAAYADNPDAFWSDRFYSLGVDDSVRAVTTDSAGNLYAGGRFRSADGVLVNGVAKWDGNEWTALGSGMGEWGEVWALALDSAGNLYAGGSFETAGGVDADNVAMWNGSIWSALGPGTDNTVTSIALDGAGNLYAGGAFSNAGGVAAGRIAMWDGSNWTPLGSGVSGYVNGIGVDGQGNVYAGGYFTEAGGVATERVAMWNGSSWSALGDNYSGGPVESLLVDSDDNVYVAGYTNSVLDNPVSKWDGNGWSTIGASGTSRGGRIYSMTISPDGTLYVGGLFESIDGTVANGLAKWDGGAWTDLETEYFYVQALTTNDAGHLYFGGWGRTGGQTALIDSLLKWDGSSWARLTDGSGDGHPGQISILATDTNDNVYAIGNSDFHPGDLEKVVKWDGSTWSTLGDGMNSPIKALTTDESGNVYAGGYFTTADGSTANRIAMWDGSSWLALGSGVEGGGSVLAIATDHLGNAYAAGEFQSIGGVAANRVAKWDGSTWAALGAGIQGNVTSLITDSEGNLYAAGEFYSAGDVAARNVAKWNGSNWVALGDGIGRRDGYEPLAMTVDTSENLYIGGDIDRAGDQEIRYLAKWDGSTWSALGQGSDTNVEALTTDSFGNIYAVGWFSDSALAMWDGNDWQQLGSGVRDVQALTSDSKGNVYAGGYFKIAGAKPSQSFAQWGPPALISPKPRSTLTDSAGTETFSWTANVPGVERCWIYVGSQPGKLITLTPVVWRKAP